MDHVRSLIREVPNFPKAGINFYDITPVLGDARAFATLVAALGEPYKKSPPTHIVGIESRGFIFGAALAMHLGCGFVPARKPGKLPCATHAQPFALEYGQDTLHLHRDALTPSDTALIVDDLIATGGTLAAALDLVRRTGAQVLGAAACIELPALGARSRILDVNVHTLLRY